METQTIIDTDTDDLFSHIRPAVCSTAAPRRTCLDCGLFLPQSRPPLCAHCHNDPQRPTRAAEKVAALQASQEAAHEAWSAYLVGLPTEIDERWQKLTSARARALSAIYRTFGMEPRRIALAAFQRRFQATERMGGALAEAIQKERAYLDQIAAYESERARWERVAAVHRSTEGA